MADDVIGENTAAEKLARRKAQKKAATERFIAKQKAEGRNYHAEWYAKNREKRRAERRAYYVDNREKVLAYQAANPEQTAAAQKRYRAKHKIRLIAVRKATRIARHAKIREIEKKSRLKHRAKRLERAKAYRLSNLLFFRAAQSKIRAQRRGVPGTYSEADVSNIFEKQRGKCAYCHRSIRKSYHVDHIIPISKGGTNWPKNIQLTCVTCNLQKHAKHPIDFAQEKGLLV